MTGYKFDSLKNGDTYAVKMEDGEVVGVCGPLEYLDVVEVNLIHFEYNAEDVAWFKEQE